MAICAQSSLPFPLPLCAVCGRKVDEVIQVREWPSGDHVFVARCHGDQEIVKLSDRDLFSLISVSSGIAFQPKMALTA